MALASQLGHAYARRRHDRQRLSRLCPACSPRPQSSGQRGQSGRPARGNASTPPVPHYRTCFVEKTIHASHRADLVVANHAVMTQAAFGARSARPQAGQRDGGASGSSSTRAPLFDAAGSAFSCLSGQEAAELRRWLQARGRGRRGRGLEQQLGDLCADNRRPRR
jgi:ATP-dependent DNA helicase DinG